MSTIERLQSEQIIVAAPMSLAGSAQRCQRLVRNNGDGTPVKLAVYGLLLPLWWLLVIAWYCTFGLLLVPYRVIRRGQRKRRVEELRHREQLAMVASMQKPAAPPEGETTG